MTTPPLRVVREAEAAAAAAEWRFEDAARFAVVAWVVAVTASVEVALWPWLRQR